MRYFRDARRNRLEGRNETGPGGVRGLASRKTMLDYYLTRTLAAFNPFGPGATSTSTS